MANVTERLANSSDSVVCASDLTHEMAAKVIPVTVLILVVACLGLLGNILILIVYSKYYRKSNFRYFVLCLAYIDMLSCLTTIPAEAHAQFNWFTFRLNFLCKIKSFLNVFTIFASALTFLFLASDRYHKICHPFSRQIQPPLARRLCVISMIISAVIASPAAVLWGTQSYIVSNGNSSVTVTICEKSDLFANRLYPLVYIVTAFALPVCTVMTLTAFCNVMIVRKLVRGVPGSSALAMDRHHTDGDSYFDDGSGLKAVSEGGQTVDTDKLQNRCKHSLKFWRHRSFPAVKLSRKRIHFCGQCNRFSPTISKEIFHDFAISEIIPEISVINGNTIETRKGTGANSHHIPNGHDLKEYNKRSVTKGNETQKRFGLKAKRSGKRNSSERYLRYALNRGRRGSSITGEIQTIYVEDNSRAALDKRTHHVSEMDITKADSIAQRGLHRWQIWREQALRRKSMNSRRKTLIMMILSSVFILTMVIYFTLVILVADVDSIFRNMSTTKTVVFFFFWRLYFINSVINPILYGLLDQRFRKGLAKLCCNQRLYR